LVTKGEILIADLMYSLGY